MLRGLLRELRLRRQAAAVWCSFCRERPRVDRDGDDRYCSDRCAEADAEMQAHG